MKNPKIGDILEIKAEQGLAYGQYTHHHPDWNAVIRVFDRLFQERPSNWSEVANLPVRFIVHFPLISAVRQKAIDVVGHAAVAAPNLEFPIFRRGLLNPDTGKVHHWWLWAGQGDYIPNLSTAKMRSLSLHRSVDIVFLEHMINTNYSPEKEWDERDASEVNHDQ